MQAAFVTVASPLSFSPCGFRKRVGVKCCANAPKFNGVSKSDQDIHLDTGGLSRQCFPHTFAFGASTSAYQVEGMALEEGRGSSIWDSFVRSSGKIKDKSTADVTVDQYHHYKEDIDLLRDLNFDSYRFSISWSRIFPDGTGKVNWKGVDYYNRLIDYLLEKGITPYVNLHHFDLPEVLEKRYSGWLCKKKEIVKDFADYADFCFKLFGDRVKNWFTLNEPRLASIFGYYYGIIAPGRCSKPIGECEEGCSPTEPYEAAHNMILAHAAAVQRYRLKYQKKQQGKIGIVLDCRWYEPFRSPRNDHEAAKRAIDFEIGWFMHPISCGEYPKSMIHNVGDRLPSFTEKERDMVRGSIDYVGINHYYTSYAEDLIELPPGLPAGYEKDRRVTVHDDKVEGANGSNNNGRPWGMYKLLMHLKDNYGHYPIIVVENGTNDASDILFPYVLHDKARVDYYKGYVDAVKNAIDNGAKVIGYFAWSLLDNWEWSRGYTTRYGIVHVDLNDQKRYPKLSAYWFQQLPPGREGEALSHSPNVSS
ncbi:beta-glucosidase 44-like [Pistacia vera]|uniref:beta-glucosidase 44-like n=1 Tax=Pistacia vera TaxID=55513 RepID=UPI001262C95E|nr:beta-glucosidase 44-like [Pistacia vera]